VYLYIMGRGRSGSTILDVLLGNSSQIESVGELLFGLSHADRDVCSCGAAVAECAFWRAVRSRVEAEGIAWEEVCGTDTRASRVWRVWRTGHADPAIARWARVTQALARAITSIAGKPHLIDSGKSPAHGLLLLRYLPDARVIHLVRDPRHVLQRYVWRVQSRSHLNARQLEILRHSALPLLVGEVMKWTLVNVVCDLITRAFPDRVVRVRFEDLCTQPARELDRIGAAFDLDLEELRSKAEGHEPLAIGHPLSGNRLRHAGEVRFDPGGGKAQPPLPRWLEAVSILLCGPLMRRYGYRLGSGDPEPARSKAVTSG
jgi:hypothetical protein